MNIYLIERTDDVGYDETASVVVIAKSYAAARREACNARGDQRDSVWSAGSSKIQELGVAFGSVAGIVLSDFRAGSAMAHKVDSLSKALDQAIKRRNDEFVATLCGNCAGTGRVYEQGLRNTCTKCGGTGKR